ncbi:MAG TPA: YXWGXW repeat-containing protein [Bryobacteraceae bacterium]|jgi:hypothetical protein
MFRTFAAAFLLTGLVACNKVPTVQAQSSDFNPSYDNLAPAAEDASQAPYPGDYQAAPPDSEAIQTSEAPPPLPEYEQPMAPGPDYYWTPGYWAWGPGGYYWVPGDWVEAPWVGAVWTPPYWGFDNGYYLFHSGYWGPHIGFYGGIDYGFGYPGRGYYGAYWNGGHLFYNSAVTRVNVNVIHNVYRHDVPRYQSSRVSFNGGHGGINVRPTQQERVVTHERRAPAQAVQMQVAQQARQEHNRTNFVAQPNRSNFNARPGPQAPQARPEQRSAPQHNEFRPAPHPGPVSPQQTPQQNPQRFNRRPEQQRAAPAPAPQATPQQPQRMNRQPDLRNHLELQRQQRPAPAPAAPRATPQPQQHAAPPAAAAPRGGGERGNGGGRGNGGERGRGDH